MTTEIVKQENTIDLTKNDLNEGALNANAIAALVAASSGEMAALFKDGESDIQGQENLFKNDILIPKVWLLQASSDLVKAGKKAQGIFINSITNEDLSSRGEILRFVVLRTFKRWQTFELVQEGNKIKKKFISSEIMVLGKNEALPYEEKINGKNIVRRQVISCYVLLENEAVKGLNRPFVIDFAATSKLGGRVIVSDISTLETAGLKSICAFFEMNEKLETFDDGDAFVKQVRMGGQIAPKHWPFLMECRNSIIALKDQIEIDERDVIVDGDKGINDDRNIVDKASAKNVSI